MIDHVSIAVRDLAASARFYEPVLAEIGLKKIVDRDDTVGFGKTYPEFWLNSRPDMPQVPTDCGTHICLRAREVEGVDRSGLGLGGDRAARTRAAPPGPGERS